MDVPAAKLREVIGQAYKDGHAMPEDVDGLEEYVDSVINDLFKFKQGPLQPHLTPYEAQRVRAGLDVIRRNSSGFGSLADEACESDAECYRGATDD